MPLSKKLDRTLRAEEDDSDDEEYYEVTDRSSPSVIDTGEGGEIASTDSEDEEPDGVEEDLADNSKGDQIRDQLSKVSFGALARAQDALAKQQPDSRKRKRGDQTTESQQQKLQALRERLRVLKEEKLRKGAQLAKRPKTPGHARPADSVEDEARSDSNSSGSDEALRGRSSKHAPAVQSSKRAVTRRRHIIDVKKPVYRDPRFDKLAGPAPDENSLKKRYSFLEDYKASEMEELRAMIKKTKNEADKEKLKRKLLSMETQKKAQERKENQQSIVREHKKKEKELIKQGKKPFYLKQSEQKKLALIDRFQNMKSKDRDKIIERRRKKATAKERKNMPDERRS
ncbi:DUF947-domain-containing protein [Lindgomyces ingoldianus]|uniref:DUF947-domain-containing protein n=1 Tax=Lindgomyces ingoldianus TaxID=673940 RepID=A0ACB6QAK6_9PLEO|nr:DUF947-domain-containing protein [Lindgomyces ingoldianus]KAF2463613.1 DUF947-domain-containing protein [Lindgomyces ingoldianus]